MTTPDDTDAVLNTIDGALTDWSMSGDAMRWSPEPDEVKPGDGIPEGWVPCDGRAWMPGFQVVTSERMPSGVVLITGVRLI